MAQRQWRPAELLLATACVIHACAFAAGTTITCFGGNDRSGFVDADAADPCDKPYCVTTATYDKQSGDIGKTSVKCEANDECHGQTCPRKKSDTMKPTITCCCRVDKCVQAPIAKPDATACADAQALTKRYLAHKKVQWQLTHGPPPTQTDVQQMETSAQKQARAECYTWGTSPCMAAAEPTGDGKLAQVSLCETRDLCDKFGGNESCGAYPTAELVVPGTLKHTPQQLLAMVDDKAHHLAMEVAKSPSTAIDPVEVKVTQNMLNPHSVQVSQPHLTFAYACCCMGHMCNQQMNMTDKVPKTCYKTNAAKTLIEEVCPRADDLCYSATYSPGGEHADLLAKLRAAGAVQSPSAIDDTYKRRSAHSCAPRAMCKFIVGSADGTGCAKSSLLGETSVCCCEGNLCNVATNETDVGGGGPATHGANGAATAAGLGPPMLYAVAALLLAAAATARPR